VLPVDAHADVAKPGSLISAVTTIGLAPEKGSTQGCAQPAADNAEPLLKPPVDVSPSRSEGGCHESL
jgi:hypothetical protein